MREEWMNMRDPLGLEIVSSRDEDRLVALLDRLEMQETSAGSPWIAEARYGLCPQPTSVVVSGFPRYQHSIQSLPAMERPKIARVAQAIHASAGQGCQFLGTVRLVGHADRDLRLGPVFERKISGDRAAQVRLALTQAIASPAIAARINWQTAAAGATQLINPAPQTEAQRAQNRRVEILISPTAVCSVPPTANSQFNAWLQTALSRVLGVRLAVNGQFDAPTRVAVMSFQKRNRLTGSYQIQPTLISRLELASLIPAPCVLAVPFIVKLEEPGIEPQASEATYKWKGDIVHLDLDGEPGIMLAPDPNGEYQMPSDGWQSARVTSVEKRGLHPNPVLWRIVSGWNAQLQPGVTQTVQLSTRLRFSLFDFNASFVKRVLYQGSQPAGVELDSGLLNLV